VSAVQVDEGQSVFPAQLVQSRGRTLPVCLVEAGAAASSRGEAGGYSGEHETPGLDEQ
jgi:hypothetical protein